MILSTNMAAASKSQAKNRRIYYSSQDQGIFFSTFDEASGKVSPLVRAAKIPNSFFLTEHPSKPVLYSLDSPARQLMAFVMSPDGSLKEINRVDSRGDVACHLVVDEAGKFVAVANYEGGISLFPIRPDGGVAEAGSIYQPTGGGPHSRQDKSYPHGLAWLPGKNIVYLTDLGTDYIYAFRIENDKFVPIPELAVKVRAGAGPRHIVLRPDSALVVNELTNTVTLLSLDRTTGRLVETDTASTLPEGFKGESWTAEIVCHPRADACYATNRGHETVAIFSIDHGKLERRQIIESGGKWPQHLAFDSRGETLFVAHTKSDNISLHRLDPKTGLQIEKVGEIPISQPMCILMSSQS